MTFIGFARTRSFAWSRIADATVNWNGLCLHLTDGAQATTAFVQKPIWDELLARAGYADRVAELISAEASRRRLDITSE